MKTALVIQGPIFSHGITGNSPPKSSRKESPVYADFDCEENISNLVSEWHSFVDFIILSGWSSDAERLAKLLDIEHIKGKVRIVLADEFMPNTDSLIKRNRKEINALRPAAGLLAAVTESKELGAEYIFKVRTDQFVPRFVEEAFTLDPSSSRIMVPRLVGETQNHFSDFYFSGTADNLEKFASLQLSNSPVSWNAHVAQFAFATAALNQLEPMNPIFLKNLVPLPHLGASSKQLKYFESQMWSRIHPLPYSVWEKCSWRGEYFGVSRHGDESIFSDFVLKKQPVIIKSPALFRNLDLIRILRLIIPSSTVLFWADTIKDWILLTFLPSLKMVFRLDGK